MATATLTNLDRAEYGTMEVDTFLLLQQIEWLKTIPQTEERDGILNLLEGIIDLTDELEDRTHG